MISKVISEDLIAGAKELIYDAGKIAIIVHTSPDGDAMGASLAMARFLNSIDKEAVVVFPDEYPASFDWMPGIKDALVHRTQTSEANAALDGADLIMCLDFNDSKRVASAQTALNNSKARKLMLDHHPDPTLHCDVTIEYPLMSATCEVVFRLICRMGHAENIDHDVAVCLYTGLMTDTGNFTYSSNNVELYYIIAELMKRGIDKEQIYRNVNSNQKESQLKLLGYMLDEKMELFPESHAAVMTLSLKEKKEYNYEKGDTEGYVNVPLKIKDIDVSVLISEEAGRLKLSFRSVGDVPVNKAAYRYFGGGGHKNAAGGEAYHMTLDEARKHVIDILPEIWNGRGLDPDR